ncbi:hypothetical protein F66182_7928 [Fusarium sp. NRRL 66182]|nr:hypothetical protein F66182_7928 [Fusarium sp. NRRL 66182]
MGGKAFARADPPLQTPRMPKIVYLEVKNKITGKLLERFSWIDSPFEGPGKKDFGDLDIIVSQANFPFVNKESVLKSISDLIGAKAQITEHGHEITAHYAVEWPDDIPYAPSDEREASPHDSSPAAQTPLRLPSITITRPSAELELDRSFVASRGLNPGRDALPSPSTWPLTEAAKSKLSLDPAKKELLSQHESSPSSAAITAPKTPGGEKKRSLSLIQRGMARLPGTLKPLSPRSLSLMAKLGFGPSSEQVVESSNKEDQKENHELSSVKTSLSLAPAPEGDLTNQPGYAPVKPKLYIQVDVHFCPVVHEAEYLRFFQAHGDLWQIIGSMIRPYGLTVDNRGLWIRIPEMERVNRSRAKVFLTSEPNRILEFLGLSVAEYWRGPFGSPEEMFEYVAKSPMFSVSPHTDPAEEAHASKSNDRRRMSQRLVYRQWVEEFKPRCRNEGRQPEALVTRDSVREAAFRAYPIGPEYQQRLTDFRYEQQKSEIKRDFIKAEFPAPKDTRDNVGHLNRALIVKAFINIILDRDYDKYGIAAPDDLWTEDGLYNMERVRAFIANSKDAVLEAAIALHSGKRQEQTASIQRAPHQAR